MEYVLGKNMPHNLSLRALRAKTISYYLGRGIRIPNRGLIADAK